MDLEQRHYRTYFLLTIAALLLLAAISYFVRPLSPVNETLYTGVAWDMWSHHHVLVPLVNDHTYNQKPPLFFWLLELGWKLFGVNNWWPMLLPTLCSIGSVLLTASTATKLFPRLRHLNVGSALILASMAYWIYYTPRARLDQLLTVCVMLSLYGLAKSMRREHGGFVLFGLGNGLALLTKGPICFVFTLIPLIAAPWYINLLKDHKARWYLSALGSLFISLIVVGAWAIPIILQHPHYAKSILWDQTAQRLSHTHHVQIKVWYYYIIRLPLLIMPWLLWPTLWKGAQQLSFKKDAVLSWLCLSCAIIFGILSFAIAQKGSRFLIPLMPLLAILIAYIITQTTYRCPPSFHRLIAIVFIALGVMLCSLSPLLMHFLPQQPTINYYHGWWGLLPLAVGMVWLKSKPTNHINMTALIALSSCCITFLLYGIAQHMHTPNDNMQPIGTLIQQLQAKQHPIAFIGTYDDRFEFSGRITQPITSLQNSQQIKQWIKQHPHGYLIETVNKKGLQPPTHKPLYQQLYRNKQIVRVWEAQKYFAFI